MAQYRCIYLYCWSICAFSIRLSLARRFWNHILIWVSDSRNDSASSKRRPRDMYSLRWNSTSSRSVCSLLNVVRWRLARPSLRRRRATIEIHTTRNKIMLIETYNNRGLGGEQPQINYTHNLDARMLCLV